MADKKAGRSNATCPTFAAMCSELLFQHQPGVSWRKEKALRMISEGHPFAEVRLALQLSHKTLTAWIKGGLPAGEPDLDQLSLIDGLSERERQAVPLEKSEEKEER